MRGMTDSPIRVVVAKPGLDGHDRGAKVVARALRDAGMEVIYTGLHQTPEQIVEAAIQEDADAIGLSVLSGAHMTLFARVIELLSERDAADIVVFGGGIIPEADIPELQRIGRRQDLHPRRHDHRDRRLGCARPWFPPDGTGGPLHDGAVGSRTTIRGTVVEGRSSTERLTLGCGVMRTRDPTTRPSAASQGL